MQLVVGDSADIWVSGLAYSLLGAQNVPRLPLETVADGQENFNDETSKRDWKEGQNP